MEWCDDMSNILIAGGTGLVGKNLVEYLKNKQHQLYIVTRSHRTSTDPNIEYVNWQEDGWGRKIRKPIDIVINLAGATLNDQWTDAYKEMILTSRMETTRALRQFLETREEVPKVLFNASAVGYYPPSETETYNEGDQFEQHNFLSSVVQAWEAEAKSFEQLGTRVVIGRFGVILAEDGGALGKMILPYRLFVGGKLGDGKQWISWVHVDDVVRAIDFSLENPSIFGIFNICAPHPVTQDEFGQTISSVLKRPHKLPLPAFVLKGLLGEQSSLVLDSIKVLPTRLQSKGFTFLYPTIPLALGDVLAKH